MLGLGNNITIPMPKVYEELSNLENYTDLDVHFDFSKLTGSHGDEVTTVTNLGAGGSDYDIDANDGAPTVDHTTLSNTSVSFPNSGDGDNFLHLKAPYVTSGKPMTLFFVIRKDTTVNEFLLASTKDSSMTDFVKITGSGSNSNVATQYDGASSVTTNIANTNPSGATTAYTVVTGVTSIIVIRRVAAEDGRTYIFADKNLYIARATTGTQTGADFQFGAIGGTTAGTNNDWNGNLGEIGIYDADIGLDNIELLLQSLCAKWDVDRDS